LAEPAAGWRKTWHNGDVDTTPAAALRARYRTSMQDRIVALARTQLIHEGADAISLRAIARSMGMASSAIHRYFPTREALLDALRQREVSTIAAAMEAADRNVADQSDYGARIGAALCVVRDWGVANPSSWMLLAGGMPATTDATSDALGARFLRYVVRPLRQARTAHYASVPPRAALVVESEVIAALDGMTDVIPRWQLATCVAAFAWACGAVSVELQAQLSLLVADPAELYHAGVEHWIAALGL
jgi:AcrR family transcriptional regulator